MYYEGQGVPQNYKTCYVWFNLSAAKATGDLHKYAAEQRDLVAKKLSAKDLKEARQIVSDWKEK
jgi:TPR repeat protein